MSFEEIVQEIPYLSIEQRKTLIALIADSLTEPEQTHSLLEFEGVGAHLSDGTDAQAHVEELRREWDHRP